MPFIQHTSFFLLIIILSFSNSRAHTKIAPSDCESYDPKPPPKGECLARLDKFPEEFKECQDNRNKTCFLFIHEPGINEIENSKKSLSTIDLQKPFPCGQYENAFKSKVYLSGVSFVIHNHTDTATDLCAWVGPDCGYNSLVDFVAAKANENYRFAVSGYLLEVAERQCLHDPSASIFDDSIVIIGERDFGKSQVSPLEKLLSPFHWGAWVIFAIIFFIFILTCLIITWHLHVYRRRSLSQAVLLLFGSADDSMRMESVKRNGVHLSRESISVRNGVVISLFRMAIGTCVLIFILFYEVAVVNFLFQESSVALPSSISKLSIAELREYGLSKDNAIEDVWLTEVNSKFGFSKKDQDQFPWIRCNGSEECLQALQNGTIKFLVTYGLEVNRFLGNKTNCARFAIIETRNTLYTYNGGWLYNSAVPYHYWKKINRQILRLRRSGMLEDILKQELDHQDCMGNTRISISPLTILIPCVLLVLPPLLASLIILFFTQRQISRQDQPVSDENSISLSDSESASTNIA